jgi:hypothetical protein
VGADGVVRLKEESFAYNDANRFLFFAVILFASLPTQPRVSCKKASFHLQEPLVHPHKKVYIKRQKRKKVDQKITWSNLFDLMAPITT